MSTKSEADVSIEFVLNVLRQHENDLDRSIAELELLVHKVEKLVDTVHLMCKDLKHTEYIGRENALQR